MRIRYKTIDKANKAYDAAERKECCMRLAIYSTFVFEVLLTYFVVLNLQSLPDGSSLCWHPWFPNSRHANVVILLGHNLLFPNPYQLCRTGELPKSLLQVNETGEMRCRSVIVGEPASTTHFVTLGTPFLRAYYTAFRINDINDLSKSTIGFAASANADGAATFLQEFSWEGDQKRSHDNIALPHASCIL